MVKYDKSTVIFGTKILFSLTTANQAAGRADSLEGALHFFRYINWAPSVAEIPKYIYQSVAEKCCIKKTLQFHVSWQVTLTEAANDNHPPMKNQTVNFSWCIFIDYLSDSELFDSGYKWGAEWLLQWSPSDFLMKWWSAYVNENWCYLFG